MELRKAPKKIVSVWLEPEETKNGEPIKKIWFCPNCGSPVCAYHGQVIDILPGSHPVKEKGKTTEYLCRGKQWRTREGQVSPTQILGLFGIKVDSASYRELSENNYPEQCGTYYSFYFSEPKVVQY
jgi:hypothetical protein